MIVEDASINTSEIMAAESNRVYIGKDCMTADDGEVRNSDMHPIHGIYSRKRGNYGKSIVINNHVWLAKDIVILKGVKIS